MTSETKGPAEGVAELSQAYRAMLDGGWVGWDASRPFLKPLGTGGQGVVYLSERSGVEGFKIPVALKVFSPDRFDRPSAYAREMSRLAGVASLVASIQQDHLVDVQNVIRHGTIHVMEMEWVDGYDLRLLLTPGAFGHVRDQVTERRWRNINEVVMTQGLEHPRLRPGTAVSIIRECLSALAALHRHGIVHNDIKPSNVMLKRSGNVKIIDIGSAFELDQRPEEQPCTPAYAAPEVLQGQPGTPASDLASIGYMLIEMLSGTHPFGGMDFPTMVHSKQTVADWLPSMLPPEEFALSEPLLRLIRGLVEPDPLDRFPSAEEAELAEGGAAEFQRELVKGDRSSEYEAEIRHWMDEVETEFDLGADAEEAITGKLLPSTKTLK